MHLCTEIQRANPEVVITIIDPKDGFSDYAPLLNADCIDLSKISFDLKPPPGVAVAKDTGVGSASAGVAAILAQTMTVSIGKINLSVRIPLADRCTIHRARTRRTCPSLPGIDYQCRTTGR